MRARIDSGDEQDARRIIVAAYDAAFLSGLKERFGFDALQLDMAKQLRDIGIRYIRGRRAEDQPEEWKSIRAEYRKLERAAGQFIGLVTSFEDRDIASDIMMAATRLGEPRPQTEFSNLSEHQKQRGDAYYHELIRLLQLLRASAADQAKLLAIPRGRHKNLGLENLTRKAAEFWTIDLGRRFSIDYHEGAGITLAFDFVKALVTPLDDVAAEQIITAMRTEIEWRGRHSQETVLRE